MHGRVNQKVGESNPGFYSPCVKVTLGKILDPKLPLMHLSVCVCVRESVDVR